MTMMVVDDDGLVATLLSLSLDALGFQQVIAEATGVAALARLDAGLCPAVIFCDLQMPGMDGVQLLRHLASRQFGGGVILLSGSDWRILKACEEMGSALGLHMLGILQKPFAPEAILPLLLRVQVARSAAAAAAAPLPITASELLQALEQGQIEAWYQPQIDTASGRPVGMEALARWQHPQRGLVLPLDFITLAESSGLIDRLMQQVLRAALAAQRALHCAGHALRLSVNLSAYNLQQPDLPQQLEALCCAARNRPGDVVLELTESGLAKSQPLALEILARLRLKGFGLSIDDFGTGYSSMAQLHRLPFTELKVDKAFVCGAANDTRSYAMFESSVLLARRLGVVSVAEGVETAGDLAVARQMGCDVLQGHWFAPALPLPALLDWLQARALAPGHPA